MRKAVSILLLCSMLLALPACGTGKVEESAGGGLKDTQEVLSEESTQETSENIAKTESYTGSNILIAYFTWADNTNVEDKDATIQSALSHYDSVGDSADYDGVDATTSASVLPPGNTAQMAEWIRQRVGGDLFSIVVTEPYSSDYDECLDRAADEKAENARPELVNHVDNMDDYDVVFLGFPNWWYTAPMAVFSFIEEYDLSGKIVVPFCAHGTGGLAASVRDITEALPDSAEVLEAIGVYRADITSAETAINEWLDNLGFVVAETNSESVKERKLRMIVDGQEISSTLYDTPAANALYDMLPLDLNFEDFNGIEKISYLSQELPTEGEPDGCDPDVGDLCLYAPWGNLSIFYQDFWYSDSLIMLGHIDSGMDVISEIDEDFRVTLERVD